MIVINFKTYKLGKGAVKLAKVVEKYLPKAVVAVSPFDIKDVVENSRLKVYVEHMDYFEKGRATGFIIPEDVKDAGAKGSLLNHSEHRITEHTIERTMKRAKKVGLKIILCVDSIKQAKRLKGLKPYAMAFEDAELVGSGKSIIKYRQKEVKKFVKVLEGSRIVPLCGAGIHSKEDVVAAKELGCKGVLIASAIAHSKKPRKFLRDLKGL